MSEISLREAAQDVLNMVDYMLANGEWYKAHERAGNLRVVLAQQQEPVAWRRREVYEDGLSGAWHYFGWAETGMTMRLVAAWNATPGMECETIPAMSDPQPAPVAQPMLEFDEIDDETIDAACVAGGIYRVDLMHAYNVLRAHNIGTKT